MRPNQQNNKNRSRGRNNNGGRKHLNPLSRNYESNGPDVKVRGSASHVAEKYLQLARDAQSSGDSVMAENYLQHAEHYFRIVAAAQAQLNQQRGEQAGQVSPADAVDDDDDFPPINDRFASPEPPASRMQPQQQSQPSPEGQPASAEGDVGGETAQPADVAAAGDGSGQGEGDASRRPRERRGRRRRSAGSEPGADPAETAQPEVGELPAFLTVGSAAAE